MAEKEERILHIVQKLDGRFVGENRITRQEAIERMAKAFFKSWYGEGFEQEHPDLQIRYIESAEAALNSLLEE